MGWGQQRKTRVSNKLSAPNRNDGSDGDIQVRQTNLGAKLFAKIGGSWNSTFLSSEEEIIGTSGTAISMSSSGTLSVDEIKLTGKITLESKGTQNICIGTGNIDLGTDNISIGVGAGNALASGAVQNVLIGTEAGHDITTGDANVFIGYKAGDKNTSLGNVCVGPNSGGANLAGGADHFNTYIGYSALASSGVDLQNEVVICGGGTGGGGATGNGDHTVTLGDDNASIQIYCGEAQQGVLRTTSLDLLERSSDPTEPAAGHAVIWMSDGTGKGADGDVLIASNPAGTTYYNTLFDHSASSSNTW